MQEERFSLYLDLEEGRKADLEVVARASLALTAMIKELSYVIDPSIEIRIELESGTKGSLSLNTLLSVARSIDKKTIASIIVSIAVVLYQDGRSFFIQQWLGSLFGSEKDSGRKLSNDERAEVEATVNSAIQNKLAKEHSEQLYREIDRDNSIKGVGATTAPGEKPATIINRDQFKARGGHPEIVVELSETRSKTAMQAVTLVSPVLAADAKRKWRFKANDIEFSAGVADTKFVNDLIKGKLRVVMKGDIQMIVEIKTDEEKIDGVWAVKNRTILHVIKIPKQPLQTKLDFTDSDDKNEQTNRQR